MTKGLASFRLYFLIASAILGWWYLAFTPSKGIKPLKTSNREESLKKTPLPLLPLSRVEIKRGLDGDVTEMIHSIATWQIEAELLRKEGVPEIKSLTTDDFFRSQILGRQLLREETCKTPLRFLPQTCVAASFLMALVPPHQIVAIPRIVRDQKHLYSSKFTKQIPLDIDRYQAEKLYLAKPDIAFIAEYSHPATIQALSSQGIDLVSHGTFSSIADIHHALKMIGNASQREAHAELLSLYMEATMCAIDTHYILEREANSTERIVYLNHYMDFALPSPDSVTGELLNRLGIYESMTRCGVDALKKDAWNTPLDQEQLINYAPERLIISSPFAASLKKQMSQDSPFAKLPCFEKNQIFFVDEETQQTPSQYIVLAYFDLYEALSNKGIS